MDRRRRNSLAGSPLLIGAVTTLIVRRRRVPLLQRQQRPAVRADLQHQGRTARGRRACSRPTRCASPARASASSSSLSIHQNPQHRDASARSPNLKLEKKVEPLPGRHEGDRAVGLGDRPEVPRTRKGQLAARRSRRGATIPVSQTTEPVNIDELFNMFDKPHAHGDQGQHQQLRRRPRRRAGSGSTTRSHELRPLVTNAIPVLHNLACTADRPARAVRRARPRRPRRRLRWREAQANYYSDLDTFFTAFASVTPFARSGDRGRSRLARAGDVLAAPRGAADRKGDRVHAPAAAERGDAAHCRPAARARLRRRCGQPQVPPPR